MIFNPLTLKHLYKFKTSLDLFPSVDLLTLLLDNSVFVDIRMVELMVYSYKSKQVFLLDSIKSNFRKYKAGKRWIVMSINFSDDISDAVWENRKNAPKTIGIANDIMDEIAECNEEELKNIYEKLEKYQNYEENDTSNKFLDKCELNKTDRSELSKFFIWVDKENPYCDFAERFNNLVHKIINKEEAINELKITELLYRIQKYTQNTQNIKMEDFINLILIMFDQMISENIKENSESISKKRNNRKNQIGFNSEPDIPVDLEKKRKRKNDMIDDLEDKQKRDKQKRGKQTRDKPIINNTLNFKETKIEKVMSNEKYIPLDLSNAFFVYDRDNIVKDTLRKRDDLVNAVQLQFIKLHDQKRPSIYRKRGDMIKSVYSYKKLPHIISYDQDSSEEWELNNEEGISCDVITESEECDESSSDASVWIEKDSSEIEMPRNIKKPNIIFDKVKISVYFEPGKYKNANLIKSNTISENLLKDIKKAHDDGISDDRIALEYNVIWQSDKKCINSSINTEI